MLKTRYSKEITLVLIVKVMALFILWKLCFSTPTEGTLSSEAVSRHLLAPK